MYSMPVDPREKIATTRGNLIIYSLNCLEREGLTQINRLPYSIRIMLEAVLRQCNGKEITWEDVVNLAKWQPVVAQKPTLPFIPARVIMQDFTGVPSIVELAAMREAMARMGGDPKRSIHKYQ